MGAGSGRGAELTPPGRASAGRPTRLRHRVEHALFRVAAGCAGFLPEGWTQRLGAAAGWLAGSVLRIRRRVAMDNLALAFPERPPAWRARVARESYRNLGRAAATTFRLSRLTPGQVVTRSRVEGRELLAGPVARGQGVVLVTGHLGNWEVGGGALACRGLPLDVVVRPQNNPLFDRALVRARRRLGMTVISRHDSAHVLLRSLRRGRVVVLVGDQNAHAAGLAVEFFGAPASTARGAALLSLRSGAPLVLGVALHDPAATVPHRVVLERVSIAPSGVLARDVEALTRAHVAALERWVRRHPGQYLWQHRRWSRTRVAGPPPEPSPRGSV